MVPGSTPAGARAPTTPARANQAARSSGRPAPKPFADYRAEYAYVAADLRRVVLVVGSLLVILIVLHFVLAR
jgi:hypothetical protein